jgi:hypothetical protein
MKRVIKEVYPSTVIFDDFISANNYWALFQSGLMRRGLRLKEGWYDTRNASLILR